MNTKAFSLIELIIVIAVISIMAAIAFVAINPARRIGEAKNDERRVEVRSILKAIEKYSVDNMSLPPSIAGLNNDIPYMITSVSSGEDLFCEIIDTNIEEVVIGEELVDYLPVLPIDPDVTNHLAYGTGYYLTKKSDFAIQVKPCYLYGNNDVNPYQGSLGIPDPPIALSVGAFGVNSVSLGWYIPDDDGGSIIYDYSIQYKESVAGTWEIFNDGENTNTWTTVSALAADTLYLFQVAAVNDVGISNYGNIVSQQTEPAGGSGGDVG